MYKHCSVGIDDDSFLIIGGIKKYDEQDGIVKFDMSKNRWDLLWGELNIARYDHACVNYQNKKIIVAGGYGDSCGNMDSTEVIDIATREIRKVGPLQEKRRKLGMAIIGTTERNKVLVFGGYATEKTINIWNATTESWQNYEGHTKKQKL